MSTMPMIETRDATQDTGTREKARLLVCLPSLPAGGLQAMRERVGMAFAGQSVLLATPDGFDAEQGADGGNGAVRLIGYADATLWQGGWILASTSFQAAATLAQQQGVAATLLLGSEAGTLSTEAIEAMGTALLTPGVDLAMPRYTMGTHDGLVSSALLYPLTRALFGADAHMPLPLDVGFSARMGERLAVASKRRSGPEAGEPLLWPVSEACQAGYVVKEIAAGERVLPAPAGADLNSLLAEVAGSLFSDIEAKATYWQRARSAPPARPMADTGSAGLAPDELAELRPMAESFRSAFVNLQEIWSLVLPPQSLLALKKLSVLPAESFAMPASLWARTVYDFALAYHLRTINRGHLLGALTPLYLAWVTSHLRRSAGDAGHAANHVEENASAFVAEKPYLVARWRWPDRFNP